MPYEAYIKKIPTMTYEEQLDLMTALLEAIKTHAYRDAPAPEKKDCRDSYPEGYFDLFGSDPSFDIEEPEEIPWELDTKREFF